MKKMINFEIRTHLARFATMRIKLIFAGLIALLVCSGCSVGSSSLRGPNSASSFKIGKTVMISSFVVFQTLDSDFALAKNYNSQMVIAIRSSKTFNPLFDGKVIRGPFVMADTYSYETVKDDYGRSSYKTVPLMIPAAEYKQQQR
jgi:hypothetical protein